MKNLSIAKKNIIALFVLTLPLIVMMYYMIVDKNDLIHFTTKEIDGVRDIRPLKQALGVIVVSPPSKNLLAPVAKTVRETLDTDPQNFAIPKKQQALLAALDGGSALQADAMGKITELISSIADASNITLDPDTDSYFIGDIIINQTTNVLIQANALLTALKNAEDDKPVTVDHKATLEHKIAFAEAHDSLVAAAGSITTEYGKTVAGNVAGLISKNLDAGIKAFDAAIGQVNDAIKAQNADALRAGVAAVIKTTNDLNAPLSDTMVSLLKARAAVLHGDIVSRLTVSLALLVFGLFISLRVIKSITRPLHDISALMGHMAKGDLDVTVAGTDRGDEIGEIARATEVFRQNGVEARRLADEQKNAQQAKEERARRIDRALTDFDTSMNGIFKSLTSATSELEGTAGKMSSIAEETSGQATTVASAATQASSNVQTVAAAAEELAASIAEISRQVQDASGIAAEAVQIVQSTNTSMQSLSKNAGQIGDVVSLITDIAGQTNLLALNATIEAARAGDAGKGFSVVASEVKNLAGQTAKATENISRQIGAIQQSTAGAVSAINQISAIIDQISQAQSTIATAIEQQGEATKEISRNVIEASTGTAEVSRNIVNVSTAADRTGESAFSLLGSSKGLAQQTDMLRKEVQKFIASVKAS